MNKRIATISYSLSLFMVLNDKSKFIKLFDGKTFDQEKLREVRDKVQSNEYPLVYLEQNFGINSSDFKGSPISIFYISQIKLNKDEHDDRFKFDINLEEFLSLYSSDYVIEDSIIYQLLIYRVENVIPRVFINNTLVYIFEIRTLAGGALASTNNQIFIDFFHDVRYIKFCFKTKSLRFRYVLTNMNQSIDNKQFYNTFGRYRFNYNGGFGTIMVIEYDLTRHEPLAVWLWIDKSRTFMFSHEEPFLLFKNQLYMLIIFIGDTQDIKVLYPMATPYSINQIVKCIISDTTVVKSPSFLSELLEDKLTISNIKISKDHPAMGLISISISTRGYGDFILFVYDDIHGFPGLSNSTNTLIYDKIFRKE